MFTNIVLLVHMSLKYILIMHMYTIYKLNLSTVEYLHTMIHFVDATATCTSDSLSKDGSSEAQPSQLGQSLMCCMFSTIPSCMY